jgi:hypothetical protein
VANVFLEEEFGNQIVCVVVNELLEEEFGTKLFCVAFQARSWIHVIERVEFEGLEFIKTNPK